MPSVRNCVRTILIIILAAAFTAMLVAGLMLRTKVTRQNDINTALAEQLDELKEENLRLKIQIDSAYDLGEIEDRARNEFGLTKPDSVKTESIDTGAEDKAEILKAGERGDISDIISDRISSFRNILNCG